MKDKTRDYGCRNQKLTILPSKSLEISLPNSEELRSSITFFSLFSLLAFPLLPDILKGLRSETNIKKTKIQTQSQPTISSASYDEKGINFGLLSYLFPAFLIIQNALLVDIGDYVIIQNILAFLIG